MSRERDELILGLVAGYRANVAQDNAFDALAARRLGISRTDLGCLDVVQARGGVTAGELATASGLTTGAITGVIDRLELAGLVRRERDGDDRRRVNVVATDLHHERAEAIWRPLMEDWQRLLGDRSPDELRTITEFLQATAELGERHAERLRRDAGISAAPRRPSG